MPLTGSKLNKGLDMKNTINDEELDKLDFEELENLLDGYDLDSAEYDFIEGYIVSNFRNLPDPNVRGKASEKWERIIKKSNHEKINEENVSILLSDIFSKIRK